jgi:hypothetical protein
VLDARAKDAEGEYTTAQAKNGKIHQEWRILYLDQRGNVTNKGMIGGRGLYAGRPFMIVSRMWLNRVMTTANGWNVVIQTRKPADMKSTRRQ